jgi:hypothetical protein
MPSGRGPAWAAAAHLADLLIALATTATPAAAVAAASPAATTFAPWTATARTGRPGLVDPDAPPLEVGLVECAYRACRAFLVGHLHEAESSRLSGKFVAYNDGTFDLSRLRKQFCQVFLCNSVGQIAYVKLGGHAKSFLGSILLEARRQPAPEGFRRSSIESVIAADVHFQI